MTEDEMVVLHHRLDGRALEQALGVGDVQRGLAYLMLNFIFWYFVSFRM